MKRIKELFRDDSKLYWSIFFLLMFVKFGYFSFQYFPVIDDWLQYGQISLCKNIFFEKVILTKAYTVRPFASIADPYVWGVFFGQMTIPLLVLISMHSLSAFFIYKVCKYNRIRVGYIFLLIYGMMPLGIEATYWISASSRIIVGLFFMAFSMFAYTKYLELKESDISTSPLQDKPTRIQFAKAWIRNFQAKDWLALFVIFNLLSYGFYEQIMLLSVVCISLLILFNWNGLKNKIVSVIPLMNFGIICVYYKMFQNQGLLADRGKLVFGEAEVTAHAQNVISVLGTIWTEVNFYLCYNGVQRGWARILSDKAWVYCGIAAILILFASILILNEKREKEYKSGIVQIGIGAILFFVPLIIYFCIKNTWIGMRNVFPSFVGLGLMVEGISVYFLSSRYTAWIKSIIVLIILPAFILVHVSELTDYKNVSEQDRLIVQNFKKAAEHTAVFSGTKEAILCNTKANYSPQNIYFHEHINNITESDWALTGGIWAILQSRGIGKAHPLSNGGEMKREWLNSKKFEWFGLNKDFKITQLFLVKNENNIIMKDRAGVVFGSLVNIDNSKIKFVHISK